MISLPFIHQLEKRSFEFEVITVQQLQEMLTSSAGAKIVTIVTITEPEMRKAIKISKETLEDSVLENPYYNNVIKVSRVNAMINWHYDNAVNAQLKREGKEADFKPKERKWGTRLHNSPFVSHVRKSDGKNCLYLEVKVNSSLGHAYYNPSTGLQIPMEHVEPFLKEKSSSKEYQGTDKEIILRDYDVANIATIVFDGNGYMLKENIE